MTNVDINPLLIIDGGHVIYIYNKTINFCNDTFRFKDNHIMRSFCNSPTICVQPMFKWIILDLQ